MIEVLRVWSSNDPVGAGVEEMSERGIDHAPVARDDDRASSVLAYGARDGGADTEVELGDGLAAGEDVVVGIAVPIGRPEALDVADERSCRRCRDPGSCSPKSASMSTSATGERPAIDLGRLDRVLEVAGDEYVGGQLGGPGERCRSRSAC